MSVLLELKDVHTGYLDSPVVRGLSMHVNRGGIVCLLGPSGCGKTTVLRSIAGFQGISQGAIQLLGRIVSRPGLTVPPEKRQLGMVFQDYALFPHLTVSRNIGFGVRKASSNEKGRITRELLTVMGLETLGDRYPHELSGGQQQRVALARALAPRPDIVLLDEPFSNLDVELRERLSAEVREILNNLGITAVLVTHDQHEAFAFADQMGVMHGGRILQWDSAYNLYHEPADRFVADFIGKGVFVEGTLLAPDTVQTELGIIKANRAYKWPRGSQVDILLRPDDILPDAKGTLCARVETKAFKGAEILYALKLDTGSVVLSLFPSHLDYAVGEHVGIRVAADHLVAFRS